jgi:hypothetical protein
MYRKVVSLNVFYRCKTNKICNIIELITLMSQNTSTILWYPHELNIIYDKGHTNNCRLKTVLII